MAEDPKNAKAADKQGADQPAAEAQTEIRAETPAKQPAEPTSSRSEATGSVQVITKRPIYCTPGQPPLEPGELITVCPTTAREWIYAGIVRLAPGATLPDERKVATGNFPVWGASGNPPPAYQG